MGISRQRNKILVLRDFETITLDDVLIEVVGIEIPHIAALCLLLVVVFKLRLVICTLFLAFNVRMASVRELALVVTALAFLGKVRTFIDVALVAFGAGVAVSKQGKRTTHKRARGHGDMGIAACIVCAVAVLEVSASRHAVVSRLVGKIADITFGAGSEAGIRLAHGDFLGVVVETAIAAVGANTCDLH